LAEAGDRRLAEAGVFYSHLGYGQCHAMYYLYDGFNNLYLADAGVWHLAGAGDWHLAEAGVFLPG